MRAFSLLPMSVGVNLSEKLKPVTIEFYNITKCGVNVANQMAGQYLVKQVHAGGQLLSL